MPGNDCPSILRPQTSRTMSKRTHFTTVTSLPAGITRETVLNTLHAHTEMIDLNPLVIERHPIRPPPAATAEEAHCQWYSISDKISYLPGVKGSLTFLSCFHDLPDGLQTHILAPMGLDMKGRWSLGGSLPGEPRQAQELGLGVPKQGLWLKEDVEMKCNFAMTRFVRKTTEKAHSTLVDRLIEKSHLTEGEAYNERLEGASFVSRTSGGNPPGYEHHMVNPMSTRGSVGSMTSPRLSSYSQGASSDAGSQHGPTTFAQHPAYTHQQLQQQAQTPASYPPDTKHPYDPDSAFQQRQPLPPMQGGQQQQYPADTKTAPYGAPPEGSHPALQQQQQRPLYQLAEQHSSYNARHQDPTSMYPAPINHTGGGVSSPGPLNTNLRPMESAVELPGGEAKTPMELEGGPRLG